MVLTISTLSSSFLSDSPSISTSNSTLFRTRVFPSFLIEFPKPPFSNASLTLKASSFSASSTQQDNGSLEQFLNNNPPAEFSRFKKGIDGAADVFQTAVVSYTRKSPSSLLKPSLKVDLVSTVHMAEKEYYLALQKKLESYDCVLFEMITCRKALEVMRNPLKRLKGSDYSDCLNYDKTENWQHADLDYETFQLLQDAKGEGFFPVAKGESLFSVAKDMARSKESKLLPSIQEDLDPLRSKLLWAAHILPMPLVGRFLIRSVCANVESLNILKLMREYPEIEAFSRLDFRGAMKVILAKGLIMGKLLKAADVEEKSVMIGERNRVAIEALRTALKKGNNRIAILYGAGHMPDLGRRLREELDLIPSGVEWITAWP